MNTTPLWVPLVVAGLGVAGTLIAGIAGVLITQRRGDRREDKAWERERQRERELWAREDEARTFEHRRTAYTEFYESLKGMERILINYAFGATDESVFTRGAHIECYTKLQRLNLYASPQVAEAASAGYHVAQMWAVNTEHNDPDHGPFLDHQVTYDEAEMRLLSAIREDLSIPGQLTKVV